MPTQTTPLSQLIQTWLNLYEEFKAHKGGRYTATYQAALDVIAVTVANECDWMVTEEKLVLDFGIDFEVAEEFMAEHGPFATCPF